MPALLTAARLEREILQLAQKNQCAERARIRLSAWRGQGGLLEMEGGAGILHRMLAPASYDGTVECERARAGCLSRCAKES